MKIPVLTKDEKDVLILAAAHPGHNRLSNSQIALRLGISVSKVKRLLHSSFIKMKADNRIEAIRAAQGRGEITIKELYSSDELTELLSTLGPDILRRIAYLLRQGLIEHGHLSREDEQIICTDRRPDAVLTNRERDVIIGAGLGLTNKEIADRYYISGSAVTTFLNRACRKLGATNRTHAFMLALKRREVSLGEICSMNELLRLLAPLGAESLEGIAQKLEEKPWQEPAPTGS